MTSALQQLIRETMELTGAPAPTLIEDDAPVLAQAALDSSSDTDADFYLVGLIGGKEVGKSALVNALAGQPITPSTSHGVGTDMVVAYVHSSREPALRQLLDATTPGRYRIITHALPNLRRQVLLDLPDIDSHHRWHLQITRAMLRHLLYPLWISSVEKYADQRLQQLLAQVAVGNAPQNFVFCLNKADQLPRTEDSGLRSETRGSEQLPRSVLSPESSVLSSSSALSSDYAIRIARTLALSEPPRVFVISATHPESFDLPELRALLSREKAKSAVQESKDLALARQEQGLLAWLRTQDLPGRARRLQRLSQDADEAVASRLAPLLLERVLPRLMDDPPSQAAMSELALADRVARWPLVNLVHTLLSPLFLLMRSVTSRHASFSLSTDAIVDDVMRAAGEPMSGAVQSVFGHLRSTHPLIGELYDGRKLWESLPAELAAADLARRFSETLALQRAAARERLIKTNWLNPFAAPVRWLLTIGALLWFPIVQPILALGLNGREDLRHWTNIAGLLVEVLGANYLLKSAGFLAIWFIVLWLALRWNSQRRVARLVARWKSNSDPDPSLNLMAQIREWLDDLTGPIRDAMDRMNHVVDRARDLGLDAPIGRVASATQRVELAAS